MHSHRETLLFGSAPKKNKWISNSPCSDGRMAEKFINKLPIKHSSERTVKLHNPNNLFDMKRKWRWICVLWWFSFCIISSCLGEGKQLGWRCKHFLKIQNYFQYQIVSKLDVYIEFNWKKNCSLKILTSCPPSKTSSIIFKNAMQWPYQNPAIFSFPFLSMIDKLIVIEGWLEPKK